MPFRHMLAFAMLAVPCAAARGQQPGVARLVELRLEQLRAMSRIRVETAEGGRFTGQLAGVSRGVVRLSMEADTTTVATAAVRRVWERRRSTKAGAIVGGAIGVGVGVFYGLVIAALDENDTSPAGIAALGGLVVGGAGALVGAAVGAAIPHWSSIYP